MLVAEQFDRLVAPIEGRFTNEAVAVWLHTVGLEIVAILPSLEASWPSGGGQRSGSWVILPHMCGLAER
jgi:hypothetical protein